jgi:hypothetical protein
MNAAERAELRRAVERAEGKRRPTPSRPSPVMPGWAIELQDRLAALEESTRRLRRDLDDMTRRYADEQRRRVSAEERLERAVQEVKRGSAANADAARRR